MFLLLYPLSVFILFIQMQFSETNSLALACCYAVCFSSTAAARPLPVTFHRGNFSLSINSDVLSKYMLIFGGEEKLSDGIKTHLKIVTPKFSTSDETFQINVIL